MNEIWANRLVAGTKTWAEVPSSRKGAVKAVLGTRVTNAIITPEQYQVITGQPYTEV